MYKNFKKFIIGALAVLMLLGGAITPVQASGIRRIIIPAALVFHTSGATLVAGQIHIGTFMNNTSGIANLRRSGLIVHSVAANGWGGRTMWTHHSNLSGILN